MTNLTITVEEVCAYREIYYEHVKPMIRARKTKAEIDACLAYVAEEYGLTVERYRELSEFDLLQRLSKLDPSRIEIQHKDGTTVQLSKIAKFLLEMPRRTEQRD